MNISDVSFLPSSSFNLRITDLSIDLFYIGTFIGLLGGSLCACIIIYSKYKKKKMELNSVPSEVSL